MENLNVIPKMALLKLLGLGFTCNITCKFQSYGNWKSISINYHVWGLIVVFYINLGRYCCKLNLSSLYLWQNDEIKFILVLNKIGRCFWSMAILVIYRFDATFDIESALPNLSQNFETFILQNCKNTQAKPKLSKGILTLFW